MLRLHSGARVGFCSSHDRGSHSRRARAHDWSGPLPKESSPRSTHPTSTHGIGMPRVVSARPVPDSLTRTLPHRQMERHQATHLAARCVCDGVTGVAPSSASDARGVSAAGSAPPPIRGVQTCHAVPGPLSCSVVAYGSVWRAHGGVRLVTARDWCPRTFAHVWPSTP